MFSTRQMDVQKTSSQCYYMNKLNASLLKTVVFLIEGSPSWENLTYVKNTTVEV